MKNKMSKYKKPNNFPISFKLDQSCVYLTYLRFWYKLHVNNQLVGIYIS